MLIEIQKNEKEDLINFLLSSLKLNGTEQERELYSMFFNGMFDDGKINLVFYINENEELCLRTNDLKYDLFDFNIVDNEELKDYDPAVDILYSYNGYHLIYNC